MTIKLLILSMFSASGSMVNEFSIVRAEVNKEVEEPALPGTFDLGGDRLGGGGGIGEDGLGGGGSILDCMIRSTVSDTKKPRTRASAIQGDQGDCWPDVVTEMRPTLSNQRIQHYDVIQTLFQPGDDEVRSGRN
jgi:hypothetical protein